MKLILTIFSILLLTSCGIDKEAAPPISSIAGGDLDTTFSGDGFFSHHNAANGSSNDEGFAITVDNQGRVIVVGSSMNGSSNTDMVVWVLTSDGQLDNTFGTDGVYVHNNAAGGNGNDAAHGVVVDALGFIYITGYSYNGSNSDMVVWKLTPTGAPDNTFDSDGIFVHHNAAGGGIHDQGNDITLDAFNNIYVTGYSDQTASNRDMVVWKISPSGILDPTFSGDGIATQDGSAGGEDDIGNSIVVNSNNEVFVAGRSDSVSNSADMAVWKFDSAGSPAAFGSGGAYTHNNAAGGNAFDAATDLVLDSVGEIYVSGYSRNTSNNNDMVVWKLSSSGTLVSSFGSSGIYVFDITAAVGSSTSDSGEAISLDPSGNVIVVGSGNTDVVAWRLSSDGVLDNGFNGDGSFFHDSAAGGFATDAGQGMYFDTENEKLYMTGYSENASGNFDMAVWRLE